MLLTYSRMTQIKSVFLVLMIFLFSSPARGDVEVSCVFMKSCILPCRFQAGAEVGIHWNQLTAGNAQVHSYYHNKDQLLNQNQRFRGRTSLFKDQISKGNASLLLKRVVFKDKGRYKCFISTISGNKNKSYINVKVDAPIRKVNIQLVENRIICSSDGIYPAPKITWSTFPPSNVTLQNTPKVQLTEQQLHNINSSLMLSDSVTDLVYICTVSTRRNSRRATLSTTSMNVSSSETTIACTSSNIPLTSLIWRFNHSQIILTQTGADVQYTVSQEWSHQVTDVSKTGDLTLKDLSSKHDGIYMCELNNAEETYVTNTFLRIIEDVEVSCVFMESCILPCRFQAGAEVGIHWNQLTAGNAQVHSYYHNKDQLLNQNQRFRGRTSLFKDQISKGNASLLLKRVVFKDKGRYKCFISTISGNKNKSYINVKVDAPIRKVNIQLVENRIICSSDGIYPAPKITWSTFPPSNVTLQNTPKVQLTEQQLHNINSSLMLSDSVTDLVYICTVSTRRNSRRATLSTTSMNVSSSETTIPCTSSNIPLTSLIWRFNHSQTILTQTGADVQYTVSQEWSHQVTDVSKTGDLTLKDLSSKHDGIYMCELNNAEETYVTNTFLRIKEDVEVSCVFMESCILPCEFQAVAEVVIDWIQVSAGNATVHSYYYNQDQLVHQNQRFRGRTSLFKDQISQGNASLLLTGVEVQDQGRYGCYTITVNGNWNMSYINVTVDAPIRKVNIQLVENRIICSSDGIYPAPKITWSTFPPSNVTLQNTPKVQLTEQQLYNISSSLTLSGSVTDLVYICTVSTRRNSRRATLSTTSMNVSSSETTIACTSSNIPLTSLIWRFNHSQIILTQTGADVQYTVSQEWSHQVTDVSKTGDLTLKDLSSKHDGIYMCELNNAEETYVTNTFLRIIEDVEVTCVFMESCILPCEFQAGAEVRIRWNQLSAGDALVYYYDHNQDQLVHQNQRFRGRTSLFKDQISKGNASLLLTGVEVQDQGRYECYTSTARRNWNTSYINVTVDAPVLKVDIQQRENNITCRSDGIYPEPELTWSTSPQSNVTLQNTTEVLRTEQQLYNINSSLILSDSSGDLKYICTVSTQNSSETASLRIQHSSTKVAVITGVVLGAIFLVVLIVLVRRWAKNQTEARKQQNPEPPDGVSDPPEEHPLNEGENEGG